MMKVHELKTWPEPFAALRSGRKTHEVRVNDRDFKEEDLLHLREWDPRTKRYTGSELLVQAGYISQGGTFGLPDNLCCMSVKVLAWSLYGPTRIE